MSPARPDSATVPRAASIHDVAAAAGVSHQTVSRVINNHPKVSPGTRAAVIDAVERLQFRPNRAARALARGRVTTVTVLTSETSLYGYAETIRGVEEAARGAGFELVISVIASADDDALARAVEQVSEPSAGPVVVIAFDQVGARALAELPAHVRHAAVVEPAHGRTRAVDAATSSRAVWFDEVAAARAATEHLLALGHPTVHHVAAPSFRRTGDREVGWSEALHAAGLDAPPAEQSTGWDAASGHAAGLNLLGRSAPRRRGAAVTAVFCGNDDIAVGIIRAAADLGIKVPDDLSVVGFDDTPLARYLVPSLTTVRLDFAALGRRAFELLEPAEGPGAALASPAVVPQPTLMVRGSSGRPA